MSKFDGYPYTIHTNNELSLMLSGTKPLAVFCVDNICGKESFTKEVALSEQDFGTYVASGAICEDHMRFEKTLDNGILVLDYYA